MENGEQSTTVAGPVSDRVPAILLPAPALVWPELAPALTSLIGREDELATLRVRVRDPATRLLTLTGPGGLGKTRLARQVAIELRPDFDNQVAFVPLAPVHEPSLVLVTIAQTLGLLEGDRGTLARRLQRQIGDQRALLVLDNFEQVVSAAPVVAEILTVCPRLTVLATSRTRLQISGEQVHPVPPLGLEPAGDANETDAAAVRLFIERSRAVQPKIDLTSDTLTAIAAICARLDGLPLAIELAAARTALLPPPALLARLDERLPLLTGGPRDQPARLQTMSGAIAWSYQLLRPEAQALFRRLAVFTGGFDLAAATAISQRAEPALLPDLAGLIDQSLIQVDTFAAEPRYAMLETIREFGIEQLRTSGAADETRQRHAIYFQSLAEQIEPDLCGPEEGAWLDRLERDRPNLRAALAWFIETEDGTPALRLAAALFRYWEIRGYLTEGREWLRRTLALPGEVNPLVWANALWRLSHLDLYLGEYDEARRHAEQSLALAEDLGDMPGIATATWAVGLVARFSYDLTAAQPRFERALALFRALGDELGIGKCLANLARIAHAQGDLVRARALHEAALASRLELGSPRELAYQYSALAGLSRSEGNLLEARALLARSLAMFDEIGEELGYMLGLGLLARIETDAGSPTRALNPLARMLALYRKLQVPEGLAGGLEAIAAAVVSFDPVLAARVIGVVDGDHTDRSTQDRAAWQRTIATCRAALGQAAFHRHYQAGRALTLPTMAEEAATVIHELMASHPLEQSAAVATRSAGDLTPREREVLQLLVAGQTNRQIARTLFITPETAKTHVSSILTKLGVRSRTAAAVYAREHNLV